ncbi:hypothetical protein [Paenibacillus beijingensis]|uniref:Uncharacterized protein n=1 Tax=Paenibacillus beijingensis TaxID=1126833 RepID=A0A0D5NEW7_9BACL|nr:hypothetical protein [Paenibacillus beijingensis]AJY73675.1 hypothetical protein VN24_02305 [Paenibacillus beijingensis]
MISEFLLFTLFSTLEGIALISVVLCIYRFRLSECFWQIMFTVLIMDLQSFLLREELSLSNFVPIVNVFLISLLLTVILRVPIQWSFFVSVVGYIGYVLLQVAIVGLSFGWLSISEVQHNHIRGYILQAVTALIAYLLSRFLYSRGLGFSFDFDDKRLKWEQAIIYVSIPVVLIAFGLMLYEKEVFLDFLVLTAAMAFFLYYSIRKEKSDQ